MQKRITLRQAKQHFFRIMAAVQRGHAFVITREGRTVAKLMPFAAENTTSMDRSTALARTMERMRHGYPLGGGPFRRGDLYQC